jgi:hypothetical protein
MDTVLNNNCKICNGQTNNIFETKILDKYNINFFQCFNCGFIQTEKPYWLQEAYQNSMNFSDTGIMQRNNKFSKISTSLIFLFFKRREKFLDYAGGYGVFTRLMRDIGFDYYWNDPYTDNLLSRGFEQNLKDSYHLLSSFESFEHFEQPISEIEKLLMLSKNIIFSTEIVPIPFPKVQDWWYYGTEHGQHISFYSKKSLDIIANKFNVNYYNVGNLHLFTEKKIGFIGSNFLKFKFSRHILFLMSYVFILFMKSKTMNDMEELKSK